MKTSMTACLVLTAVVALGVPLAASAQSPAAAVSPSSTASGTPATDAKKPADTPGGQTTASPVKPASPKPAAKPVEKQGFARVDPNWPKWLTVTIQERGRYEAVRPPATKGAEYDGYYINRLRVTAGVNLNAWFRGTVQGQDSRVAGYDLAPTPPSSMLNRFDLRLAYLDLGRKTGKGFATSFGRQELTYGDGRILASPDWGNVSRTYDSVRAAVFAPGVRVEAFFGAPVDVTRSFSMAKTGERLGGVWATFDKVKPFAYLEGYSFAKALATAVGELNVKGDAISYATGFRAGGPVTKAVSWEAENVWETGHYGGDSLSAFGTHEAVTWTIGKSVTKPKATVEYNYATGDTDPKDGTRGTFDMMYPSTHAKWGVADLVGWRNMHHAAVKFEISPIKRLKINTAVNHFWLATVQDAWYNVSGSKVVLNRKATSRDIGWEPDVYASVTLTRDVTVGAGVGYLSAGGFVTQSTDLTGLWAPYTTFTFKF